MRLDDFFDSVEAHEELQGVGIDQADGILLVKYLPSGVVTSIPADAITADDVGWSVLEDVLTLKREPQILYHMTRVVGYYSRTENWNPSKLGELKDRRAGDYALAESAA
jgi:hypothetical protein